MNQEKSTGRRRAGRGRGFTLIEVVVTTAVLAVILGATVSVMRLTARAAAGTAGPMGAANAAAGGVAQFSRDVALASTITALTSRSISFTVPASGGGSTAITYTWSGVVGAPLLRTKGGVTTTVASDVRSFALETVRATTAGSPSATTSGEMLIGSLAMTAAGYDEYDASTTTRVSQYVATSFVAGVRQWTPTRVRFMAAPSGSVDSQLQVQIRTASGYVPASAGTAYAAQSIDEALLPGNSGWVQVAFASANAIDASERVALVFSSPNTNRGGRVTVTKNVSGNTTGTAGNSINSGTTWTMLEGPGVVYELYGTVSQVTSGEKAARASSMAVSLEVGPGAQAAAANVMLHNQPSTP